MEFWAIESTWQKCYGGGFKGKNWRQLGLNMTWLDIAQVDLVVLMAATLKSRARAICSLGY